MPPSYVADPPARQSEIQVMVELPQTAVSINLLPLLKTCVVSPSKVISLAWHWSIGFDAHRQTP
jgi:hypothetical protein